ncbi:MAG: shikimate dehydrogenase [Elusimicrobiota bacterium]
MKHPWAALIGHPIGHSLSPLIYRAFGFALDRQIHYRALDVRERKLAPTFKLARDHRWLGWNVTLPYKVRLMDFVDETDASARAAGALNLIRFHDGRATGYNTDIAGFLTPLAARGIELTGKSALILGAGGAARAAGAALTGSGVDDIVFLNRTPEKAAQLAAQFDGRAGALVERVLNQELPAADIVVQATSLGLDGTANPLPYVMRFKKGALAYDLVYRPQETPFLKTAASGGATTVGGLEMLVAQAAAAWNIWFAETVPGGVTARIIQQLERKLDEDT